MKFSSLAVTALCLCARAEAFTGPQLKPRFGLQVRMSYDVTMLKVYRTSEALYLDGSSEGPSQAILWYA